MEVEGGRGQGAWHESQEHELRPANQCQNAGLIKNPRLQCNTRASPQTQTPRAYNRTLSLYVKDV